MAPRSNTERGCKRQSLNLSFKIVLMSLASLFLVQLLVVPNLLHHLSIYRVQTFEKKKPYQNIVKLLKL